jgi:hypothetical protein
MVELDKDVSEEEKNLFEGMTKKQITEMKKLWEEHNKSINEETEEPEDIPRAKDVDWDSQTKKLDRYEKEWFNPSVGVYNIKIVDDGWQYTIPDKFNPGSIISKIGFNIIANEKPFTWSVTASENPGLSSLFGQLLYLIRKNGTVKGLEFNLVVNMDKDQSTKKPKRSYTINEVVEARQKEREENE